MSGDEIAGDEMSEDEKSPTLQNAYKHIKTPLLRLYKQSHNTGYTPKPET